MELVSRDVAFPEMLSKLSRFFEKIKTILTRFLRKIKKIAMDDPRRIAHSIKVGLALTLVSTLFYVTAFYDGFGESAVWAVMTVVVVMEYTAGATLYKGLNRAFATVIAGFLAVGVRYLAALSGSKGEMYVIAIFVFLLAALATFTRFIPAVNTKFDYGVMAFILTFSMIEVSSYREDEIIQTAQQRLSTIAIGVAICLGISIFVFPVWAGEDLHKMVASNLNTLASSLEGIKSECFGETLNFEGLEEKAFLQVHKRVLDSKAKEDVLCKFAIWEPSHGNFGYRHPWKQYQAVGRLIWQCAASIDAHTSYLSELSKTRPLFKADVELILHFQTACIVMATESAQALRELSSAILSMTVPSRASYHVLAATSAATKLRTALPNHITVWETVHVAMVASLLAELTNCTKEIADSVDQLALLAKFKTVDSVHSGATTPVLDKEIPQQVVIDNLS